MFKLQKNGGKIAGSYFSCNDDCFLIKVVNFRVSLLPGLFTATKLTRRVQTLTCISRPHLLTKTCSWKASLSSGTNSLSCRALAVNLHLLQRSVDKVSFLNYPIEKNTCIIPILSFFYRKLNQSCPRAGILR